MARTPGKDPFAPPEPVDNPPPTDDPGGGDGSAPAPPPPNPDPSPDPDDPTSSRRAHRSRAADGDASLAPTDPGRVIELELRLAELERALNDSNEQLEQANRRYEIDLLLSGAGVVDIETARVMTENLISDMQVDDVAEAIEALRGRKPFLFSGHDQAGTGVAGPGMAGLGAMGAGVMGVGVAARSPAASLDAIADDARTSGDRRELLRYLRARRGD